MGKLEREVIQQGWCSFETYKQLKKVTWFDKIIIWIKRR